MPLTAVVLTFNEEVNLGTCLDSLAGLGADLIVVDSGSSDRTVAIAEERGATVLHHAFGGHASQWQWALAQLTADRDWVLGLDADQSLSPELRSQLNWVFHDNADALAHVDGLYVTRRQIFRGTWIRHGGYYPKYLLKLFRSSRVQIDERDLMDHHFYVAGKTAKLAGDLIEDNKKEADLDFWLTKHIQYANLHAREELIRRQAEHQWLIQPALFGSPDQRIVWFKRIWFRLPLFVRPFLYFFYRYVIKAGFRDGKQGFIFHFLQSFWYRLLVDIRLDELLSSTDRTATKLTKSSGVQQLDGRI